VLESLQPALQLFSAPSKARAVRKLFKATPEAVTIEARLVNSTPVNCIISNGFKVFDCQPGQAITRHFSLQTQPKIHPY